MKIGMRYELCLMAVLILIPLTVGCSKTESRERKQGKDRAADRPAGASVESEKTIEPERLRRYVEKLCRDAGADNSAYLDNKVALGIRLRIRKDISQGEQQLPAALILSEGTWKRTGWFIAAETAFAEAWLYRMNPITEGASAQTMKALRHLAETGRSRQARVAASAAIAKTAPELAKKVLVQEYANFDLRETAPPLPGTQIPLSSGQYLADLGINAVPEITDIGDFGSLLKKHPTRGGHLKEGDSHNYHAANLLNKRLRKLLQEGRQNSIGSWIDLSELAHACLEEARRTPAEPERALWGE